MNEKYELRYLRMFEQDLAAVQDYITFDLQNPQAAQRLIDDVEKAIHRRLGMPLSFAAYNSAKDRAHTYYTIRVKNYTVFYVVIGNVMEVRRFIYSRRNLAELL
jgi:plasmid stabilization system protein ParE